MVASCGGRQAGSGERIAVVGAGIVGAAIAYNLAQGGAKVTVLDRHGIATRTSRGTFAWLNATWAKQPRHYHRLNQLGLAAWKELGRDLSIPIRWGGSIEWFPTEQRQKRLAEQIAEQVEWGEPARMIAQEELAELEPEVDFAGISSAAFSPNDGALDPVMASRMLLERAAEQGATIRTPCTVTSAKRTRTGSHILETECGELKVDKFVLATGADPDATLRLAGVEIPQRSTPGVIAITKPMKQVLGRILVAPGVHLHQRLDGRVVLGEQDGAPKTEAHARRLAGMPYDFPSREIAIEHAARILETAIRFVPRLADAEVEDVYIGWRPLPLDGHPVIGPTPGETGAYVAIAHSGVTLAPIIGKLAAQELLSGKSASLLAPYRADRSFAEIRRY